MRSLVLVLGLAGAAAHEKGIVLKWGKDGHSLVAGMAQTLVSADTTAAIKALLDGQELDDVSSWADDVRYYSEYSWSQPLHFINAPDEECDYEPERDCVMAAYPYSPDYCVAGAITNYTAQVMDPQSEYNRTEALMFVTHFLGDLAQPLHVGWTTDLGGNRIDVEFQGYSTNLHSLWDTKMIDATMDADYGGSLSAYRSYLEEEIATTYADQVEGWADCDGEVTCPHVWAADSLTVACDYAYADVESGDTISDEYFSSRMPVVEEMLCKGAVRLAATLDRAFAAAAAAAAAAAGEL